MSGKRELKTVRAGVPRFDVGCRISERHGLQHAVTTKNDATHVASPLFCTDPRCDSGAATRCTVINE
jgi:hypothetical protein